MNVVLEMVAVITSAPTHQALSNVPVEVGTSWTAMEEAAMVMPLL